MGHCLAFSAVVSYARFVVLDAQGLVTASPRITGKRKTQKSVGQSKTDDAQSTRAEGPSTLSAAEYVRRKQQLAQSAKSSASASQWVDGSHPERDRYDDGDDDESSDDRNLSK